MSRPRRSYTPEYRVEAAHRVIDGNRRVAEVARELANRGAEVIAWPVWGCNPLLAAARACENHVYLVSSTYTDAAADWTKTAVYDHGGQPLAVAQRWGTVVITEIDLNQRHFWRNNLGDFKAENFRHRPAVTPEQ